MKSGIYLGKRYEVLSKIGAGGMADVYKGKDHKLNRYVAIKVLKREFREDSSFVKKFRSEAQAAAGLMNPNIVNVYDVGEDRGLYYMVMELVEGITLKEYIDKKGRLSAKEVISIAIQMCNGIQAAHQRQIVHRDIKPHNVIISKDGKVKVTDFGIAKAASSVTVSTSAMGSVHYTSPEQARGGYVDAKSDIYSIGITLYEMVTGRVPFNGESTVEVAVKHLQEEITPPSELAEDIPYSLEQIILKCTQKNTECRYENVEELIQDLKHSLVDPEGDFVELVPQHDASTMIITEEELGDIRNAYTEEEDEDYGEDEDDEYEEGGSDEVNPRMNKIMKILTIVVAVLIVIVLAVVVGKATGLLRFGQGVIETDSEGRIKVPNLVGKKEGEVRELLDKAGLDCVVKERRESSKYEEGYVIDQNPEVGERLEKGDEVSIVVSTGKTSKEIAVPDVSGKDETEAQKELNDAGFSKVKSEAVYSEKPQGTVIGTNPKAGTKVTKDTEIVMQVSKGEEKNSIPNVVGQEENAAKAAIKENGFSVAGIESEYSETVPQGHVIRQSPDGGAKADAGTSVTLVISLGKKPDNNVNVTSFIGSSESELLSWASSNGLNAVRSGEEYSNNYAKGTIISQNPQSGRVEKGSTIRYVVSKGAEPVLPEEPENGTGNGQ